VKQLAMTLTACLVCAFSAVAHAAGQPAVPPWGVDLSFIDKTVKPGDDFFLYANGAWYKKNTIPADRSYSGVNLELNLQNEARLKSIVADLHTRKDLSVEERKLRDLYDAYTDQKQIEANGLKPAKSDLAAIAGLKSLDDVARAMGTPALSLDGPFGGGIFVDQKNPNIYEMYLGQSGLGMPDRDYYLKTDKEIVKAQGAYKKYIGEMLSFAGVKDAGPRADKVYALERDIAVASWPAPDRRDAEKTYNPMKISDLEKLAPQFPWSAYFAAGKLSRSSPHGERIVVVSEKSAFPKLAAVFAKTPVDVWRDYLTVHAQLRAIPAQGGGRCGLRLLRHRDPGQAQAARPRHARRPVARRGLGRGAGQGLCRQIFPAGS
jgi:putative endopeptidase